MATAKSTAKDIPEGYELVKKEPLIPETWPGAFGAYKYSRNAIRSNILILLWLFLASIAVGILSSIGENGGILYIFMVIYYVLSILLQIAYYVWTLTVAQGKKLEFQEILKLSAEPKIYLNMIGLGILIVPILAVSFLLFIVPFFIVFPRLIISPYYILDKQMNCVDALQASWNDTKGYSGLIYGTIGATLAMALLMITIIGIPFSIYFLIMYSAISAIVYEYIKHKGLATKSQPAAQPAKA